MKSLQPKIQIENLMKIYGDNHRQVLRLFRQGQTKNFIREQTGHVIAIEDVSLTINQGELFVVMGLSGSGKSTLVRCINRLIHSTSGQVYIDSEDIIRVSERRMRELRRTKVAMVFQRFGLFPHKKVVENVEYGLKVRGVRKKQRQEKALATLEVVGLQQWANYYPRELSGGMQQRVGLARALATDAEILLMDEAFSALDPLIRREMQDELIRLQNEFHKTIVFISHDIQEALKLGDRVAVMKDGCIVQVATPEEMIARPANDYIKGFTRDVNRATIIKAGAIASPRTPLILGRDSIDSAISQIQEQNYEQMYVVDVDGKPVGFVTEKWLRNALEFGEGNLAKIMQINFPKVEVSVKLEEVFPLCDRGEAIAVVDQNGKFAGVVEQANIFASMAKW